MRNAIVIISEKRQLLTNDIAVVKDIKEVSAGASQWAIVNACKLKLENMYYADKILADIEKELISLSKQEE